MDIFNKLRSTLDSVKENELLASFTTFKIGGPAKYFCAPNSKIELIKIIQLADKIKLPYFILAGGSNILISDQGFAGLVIKMNLKQLKIKDNFIVAEAGVLLSRAVGEAASHNLSGLEWATGIPGTIGGAVFGNTGAYGGEMSQSVEEVIILRRGKERILKNKDCAFGYRSSIFNQTENGDIIVSAKLKLTVGDKEVIQNKIKKILSERKEKVDSRPSAGSIFRNVILSDQETLEFKNKFSDFPDEFVKYKKIPAAWLIEQGGLKGKVVGGAKVSDSHANILINNGEATAADVTELISIIKQEVKNKFGVELEEEVRKVGFDEEIGNRK